MHGAISRRSRRRSNARQSCKRPSITCIAVLMLQVLATDAVCRTAVLQLLLLIKLVQANVLHTVMTRCCCCCRRSCNRQPCRTLHVQPMVTTYLRLLLHILWTNTSCSCR